MNPTLTGETGIFKFQGSLVPSSNELYSLGSTTSRWKDLNVSGSVNAASFVGDGSLLTGITSGGTSLWSQSSSNVYVTGSNVGINTPTPTNALHVVGNTRIEGNLTVNGTQTIVNTNVGTTEQLVITNDGTGPALVVNQTGTQPVLDVQDDGVSVLKIIDGGNVGVGTTNPQAKLHVNGPVSISGALLNNNVVMSALLYSGSFTVASATYTSTISLPTTGYSMFEVKFWGASTSDTLGGLFIDANFTNSTHGGWRSVTDVPRYERSTLFTSLSGDLLNQTSASKEIGHYIGNLSLDFHGKITFPSTTLWQGGGGGLYRHHTGSLASGNTAGRGASTYTSTSMAGYNSQATINAIRFYHAAAGITIHYRVFAY